MKQEGSMIGSRTTRNIPCIVEIEQTPDSLHAHVMLEGIDPGPGDKVIVHGAPTQIRFGERGTFHCHATLIHAGLFARQTTRLLSYLELTELYEIGFSAGSAS
jgi:hypothetical protein